MAEIYSFEIATEVSKARQAIEKFTADTQKKLDGITINTTVSAIVDSFDLISSVADKTIGGMLRSFGKLVDAAAEQEEAVNRLNTSLKLSGTFSQDASRRIQDFADQIQRSTVLSDEAVLAATALARNFARTNDEAVRLTRAAIELSSATGVTLEGAIKNLGKTFGGLTGELGESLPIIKSLTVEQLKAGEAIDLILSRFGGSAAGDVEVYNGSIKQLTNSTKELAESLGSIVTGSDLAKSAIREASAEITALADSINKGNFIQAFFDVKVGEGFKEAAGRLKELEEAAVDVEAAMKNAMRAATSTGAADAQALRQSQIAAEREDALKKFNAIRSNLEVAGLNEIQKINKEAYDRIAIIQKAVTTGAVSDVRQAEKFIENVKIDRAKRVAEQEKKILDASLADEKKARADALARTKSLASMDFVAEVEIGEIKGLKDLAAVSAGFVANVLKGAQGAQKLISTAVGRAADLVIPGIGSAVTEIVDVLSQGPEKTRQMVEEFARSIPKIIESLAESLPVLIETLARELPPALAKAMPTVALGFSTALIRNIPNIVAGFAKGLLEAVKAAGQALIDMIKDIPGDIFGGLTGKDSGGFFEGIPVLGGIGDLLGFAEGGRTQRDPRLAGDRGLVRIGPNEQTFDSDLTDRMERYLDRNETGSGGGGAPRYLNVALQIGLREISNVLVDLERGDYRTGRVNA